MRALLVVLVVLAVVVGLVVWGVGINNQLVRLEQGVNETSAQVQNVYQRSSRRSRASPLRSARC